MAKQEVSISELVVLLIGARFPDCDFFFINEYHSNMPQHLCMCTVL